MLNQDICLPRLVQHPSHNALVSALSSLRPAPASFLSPVAPPLDARCISYMTKLISSDLSWLDESQGEDVRALASELISLQCGRAAAPSMTRTFAIPMSKSSLSGALEDSIDIQIHEPTLTADSLGLKTWASSFLLSRILHILVPPLLLQHSSSDPLTVLELGSGTGLVGISLAKLFTDMVQCTLTDYLPEIIDNLYGNLALNGLQLESSEPIGATTAVELLDWNMPERSRLVGKRFGLVVASDFMYAPSHALLVPAMFDHFSECYVLAAYPLRSSNTDLIDTFKKEMAKSWREVQRGIEMGYDDWGGNEQVSCHWHLYTRQCDAV